MTCGCPFPERITDPELHAAWHRLVLEQGGPGVLVNAMTLQEARGWKTPTISGETILDIRARESGKRASGALRRASHD